MALARKCDICGEFFEYDPNGCDEISFRNLDKNRSTSELEEYDCCPNCMESIKNYIETLKG